MQDPLSTHVESIYRILRYLKSVTEKRLLFSDNGHMTIECFTDVDWARSPDTGDQYQVITFVGGNLATWRCKTDGCC